MGIRLIFIINVFNEAQHIKKCIESIHEVADEVWVFDGAYKNYPHEAPISTDGTLNIVKKFSKVKLYVRGAAWNSQIQKRTAMFKDGKEGDYFFKLDGDEYVTNPEIIRDYLDGDVGWAWTISNLYAEPTMITRIFKWQEGLHYAGRHHWLYNGKNEFVVSDQNMNPAFVNKQTPIRVVNFRDSSNRKRKSQKIKFLINRNPDEQKYRNELSVYNKPATIIPHQHKAGKPRRDALVLREAENPQYTFSIMISRPWAVEKYFNCLKDLELPTSIEAVVVIDHFDLRIKDRVIKYFKGDKRFDGVKIYMTGKQPFPESSEVRFRRQRIVDNLFIIITEARGNVLLGSEDDSLPQKDAYTKLLNDLRDTGADFAQGNIIGRWNSKICPAWKVEEKDGAPYMVWNAKEKSSGIEEIQGCGWYCFASYMDVFRKYQMYVDDTLCLGPDLRFGYILWKNGFKLIHDWSIKVEHFGKDFSLMPGRELTEQKKWIKKNGKWEIRDYE